MINADYSKLEERVLASSTETVPAHHHLAYSGSVVGTKTGRQSSKEPTLCANISSSEQAIWETVLAGPSSLADSTSSSTPLLCTFSARSAGKSTLKRLWLEATARRYLGELSRTAARGVSPHTSPAILLAAYSLPKVAIPTSFQRYLMPR